MLRALEWALIGVVLRALEWALAPILCFAWVVSHSFVQYILLVHYSNDLLYWLAPKHKGSAGNFHVKQKL